MKKLLFLSSIIVLLFSNSYSQTILFEDNFNSYTAGEFLALQSENWTTWSNLAGGDEDARISTDQFLSAPNSLLIEGTSDVVLLVDDRTEKKYVLKFNIFVETGFGGYYNLLHKYGVGGANSEWALEVFFSQDGTGFINAGGSNSASFTYTQNTWIECFHVVDLDGDNGVIRIGGQSVYAWQWSLTAGGDPGEKQLAALNLWAGAPEGQIPKYYIDDLSFTGLYTIFDHDVATRQIHGETNFSVGDTCKPSALIKNEGLNSESFDVICEIFDFENTPLYSNTQTVSTIDERSSQTINFDAFVLSTANDLLKVVVYTKLQNDMDTSNDTLFKHINTYTTSKNNVVLEKATATWCYYCPGAAKGVQDLLSNNYDIAVIAYHGSDPYSNMHGDARIGYYAVSGYPTAVFDGVDRVVGGNHTQSMYQYYLPIVSEKLLMKTAFDVSISGSAKTENDFDLTIVVKKMAPSLHNNLTLHVVLTESEIAVNWQGLNKLNFVARLMIPDANGTVISTSEDSSIIQLDFSKKSNWNSEHCELVAFLQNHSTKTILQSEKIKLSELTPVSVKQRANSTLPETTALMNNYPNPFNANTIISYQLSEDSFVELTIHTILGQKIERLVSEQQNAGIHKIEWNANAHPSGGYLYQFYAKDPPQAGQSFVQTKKLILLK